MLANSSYYMSLLSTNYDDTLVHTIKHLYPTFIFHLNDLFSAL